MKRILYICQGAGFAGAESYALSLIRGMARRKGVRCYLATFYEGPLWAGLQCENVELIRLFGRDNIKSLLSIVSIMRRNGIDLVHLIDQKSTIVGGFSSIFVRNIQVVSTVHGLPEFPSSFLKKIKYLVSLVLYFFVLNFLVHKVVAVSHDLRSRIGAVLRNRISVIHNGINLENTEIYQKALASVDQGYLVGAVGRLEEVKGHKYFIEAAKMVLARRRDVRFQIVGIGSLEQKLKELARLLGIEDRIEFLGHRTDARQLIANFDIFVMPSLHEGIPFVLLEAMATGRPVICSNVGGIPEIIENESCGILVTSKDTNALYENIMTLLDSKEKRVYLGENSLARIREKFSEKSFLESMFRLYQ